MEECPGSGSVIMNIIEHNYCSACGQYFYMPLATFDINGILTKQAAAAVIPYHQRVKIEPR